MGKLPLAVVKSVVFKTQSQPGGIGDRRQAGRDSLSGQTGSLVRPLSWNCETSLPDALIILQEKTKQNKTFFCFVF